MEQNMTLSPEQVNEIRQMINALEQQSASVSDEVRSLLKGLVDVVESDQQHIIRSMTFPEVYLQTGISLLHYFGRVVQFTYPKIPVKLAVSQDGRAVKLAIEVAENNHHAIEELLENYGLALKGKLPLNEVLSNTNHLMEWKQKLDLSALEVKVTRDLLESPDDVRNQEIEALASDARNLHTLVGDGVSGLHALTAVIGSALDENKSQINGALLVLQKKLAGKVTVEDEAEVKDALETILRYDSELFRQIHDTIAGKTVSGRVADTLLSWVSSLAGVMPR